MTDLHLDFETYSEVPFGKAKNAVSLDVYAKHPSTEVTLTAWAIDQSPVCQIEEGFTPADLGSAVEDPNVIFHAFNAPFERAIMREVLGIEVPIERWRCTMVHAYHLGFAGSLGMVGEQLGLPADKQKLAEGSRLINKFAKPAPKNHNADRYTKENAPEDWERFQDYNRQDVVAEREIGMLLARYPMPQSEWDLWFTDQRINDRGLPVDRELVDQAVKVYHAERRHLAGLLKTLTGLENPNSQPQLLAWLKVRGYPYDNLQAETVDDALELPIWEVDDEMREALELRQQLARTAGAKWEAFERMTDWDTGRLRGVFQFNGAQRTGRWAGRGVQPHNLHRSPKDQDQKVEALLSGDRDFIEVMYG